MFELFEMATNVFFPTLWAPSEKFLALAEVSLQFSQLSAVY